MMLSRLSRFRAAATPLARHMSTVAPARSTLRSKLTSPVVLGTAAATIGGLQYWLGKGDDFFDFRFVTDKKPNDLAEFYGSEDFMEIFCIFPFVVEFMMKNGEFQADAVPGYDQTVNTFGFGGRGGMEVSMAFDEGEIDTTGDGKPDTIAYFNKRERFKDWAPFLPKYMEVVFWDLTQNFGYTQRADGTCEVYHHGETFYGPFPIRIVFTLHAAYVAWATKRYIQRPEFGDLDKADQNHHDRRNIPKDVFNEFLEGLTSGCARAHVATPAARFPCPPASHRKTCSLAVPPPQRHVCTRALTRTLSHRSDESARCVTFSGDTPHVSPIA